MRPRWQLIFLFACGGSPAPAVVVVPPTATSASASAVAVAPSTTTAPSPPPGELAPTMRIVGFKGTIELGHGKVTVVDFWATWCAPCKEAFPKLEALYSKYRERGLTVVGVGMDDDAADIQQFAAQMKTTFPLAMDPKKTLLGAWKVKTMPSTFVVDKAGLVRFKHLGYTSDEPAQLEAEISSLLDEP